MFDMRDLSNTSIALIIIIALSSAITVHALTTTSITNPAIFTPQPLRQVPIDLDMSFELAPSNITVEAGDTFEVTVVVGNATNMFGWQVYVAYDPTRLQCIGASFPSDYVFSHSVTVSGALATFDHTQFHGDPIQGVRNDEGWIVAGDCLLGLTQPTFNGSGFLCQLGFRVVSRGSTVLALLHDPGSVYQTYNLRPDISTVTSPSDSYTTINVLPQ